ncbi:Ros/MucR family transcriptional regulator [Sphingobium baderi]|uniref:MucR family transcriptional regulator n=1 Tax=Sphingobium baderi TaxID=1332080 RepID=UPI002B40A4A8|nr:MucR family transcriptional regulator [Sphingobium baderi]WRD78839.1 MucR family transcriptional regulator [Sphingobium baderi]
MITSGNKPPLLPHRSPNMTNDAQPDVTALAVQLLSAFVSNNSLEAEALPELIRSTRAALGQDAISPETNPAAEKFTPAVSIRKSIASPDHILSLIDGKPYKTLKRHLSGHGLTPAQYRERYKLPEDYPLVAAGYSQARRAIARKLGLGRKPTALVKAPKPQPTADAPSDMPARKPGRKPAVKKAAGSAKAPHGASRKNATQKPVLSIKFPATAAQSDVISATRQGQTAATAGPEVKKG